MNRKTDNLDFRIGCNLKKLRKYAKLTQTEVGYILNVTAQQIAKYEVGKNRISASALYRLVSYYNRDINCFFIMSINEIEALKFFYKN